MIGLALILSGFAPAPGGLSEPAWFALAVAAAMAALWVTEALPLAATALIPLAAFPLAGVAPIADLAGAYAHPLIFLFLGGFLIGRALERHGAPQRIGAAILAAARGRPGAAVAGLMAASAFFSLWISNTATAMIMAPVAAALGAGRAEGDGTAPAALLGVAFAATIGGMGSLIGTPPNALFAAWAERALGVEVGFAEWAMIGLPAAAALLPVAYLVLTRVAFTLGPPTAAGERRDAPPLGGPAKRVLAVAGLAAFAWAFRPILTAWPPLASLTDAGIAVLAALALFAAPDGRGARLLDWEAAKSIRWDVLILFGGGIALADALDRTGAAAWLAGARAVGDGAPTFAAILVFAAAIVLVGELASNTAMAAIFLPVAGATAAALGADPLTFVAPVALAASIGFMLPVATPPNAIVFAYPAVTRADMLRAGAPLDAIGIVVAAGIGALLAPLALGG
ncbi:MAG: DASS family sodium-coupled anion symporter [Pseudomonadota bacterium]